MAKNMKKRIFAGLLVLVMVAALFPVTAFASTDLTKCEVTTKIPYIGKTLDYAPKVVVDPQDSASIDSVTWYKTLKSSYDYNPGATNAWTEIDRDAVAEDGYLYKIVIKMSMSDGYVVAQDAEISSNGDGLDREVDSDRGCWIGLDDCFYISDYFTTTQPTKLTTFAATINEPKVGEVLDYAPQATATPQNSASIDSVTWYKTIQDEYNIGEENDWTKLSENETAEKGYLYKAVIKAPLGENCIVADDAAITINGVKLSKDAFPDDGYHIENGCLYLSGVFSPNLIDLTSFEATINTPKVGEKLDYTPSTTATPQNGATVEDVKWYKILKADYDDSPDAINNWVMMDKDEVAQKGYLYGVVIKAPLSAECIAAENMTVKLNNVVLPESLTGGTNMYYVDDDVLFMFYDFEPAAETPTPEPTKPATPTPEATNSATATGVKGAKTGDANDMTMWIVLLAAGMAIGTSVVVKRKHSGK